MIIFFGPVIRVKYHCFLLLQINFIISGIRRVWHSGSIATYKSLVWFYPELGIGLFNDINGPPDSGSSWALMLILQYITDLLLGEEPWLTKEDACRFPAPYDEDDTNNPSSGSIPPIPRDTPPHPLDKYTGKYNHPGFGDISISKASTNDHLLLSMGQFLRAQLFYNETEEKFRTNFTDRYWFMTDRIPVIFKATSVTDQMDTLDIPMNSPYDTVKPFSFLKGKAAKVNRENPNYKFCASSYSKTTFHFSILFINILLVVVMSQF